VEDGITAVAAGLRVTGMVSGVEITFTVGQVNYWICLIVFSFLGETLFRNLFIFSHVDVLCKHLVAAYFLLLLYWNYCMLRTGNNTAVRACLMIVAILLTQKHNLAFYEPVLLHIHFYFLKISLRCTSRTSVK